MRSYWCDRWDNLRLREVLSRHDEPKYRVERKAVGGALVVLERLEFLWYRGLLSAGRHLASGRYVKDPIHLTLRGLGPRELVFPRSLLEQLARLVLIGGWERYARCAGVDLERSTGGEPGERLAMRVDRIERATAAPLLTRWGESTAATTLCLVGTAVNTRLAGRALVVPVRELRWNELAGYRARYLAT